MRDYIQPFDLRRLRAQRLTGAIMNEISRLIEGDNAREINRAIYDLLWRSGADMITDHDRSNAGLPDRGNNGYTHDELHILEAKRIQMLLSPMPPFSWKKRATIPRMRNEGKTK